MIAPLLSMLAMTVFDGPALLAILGPTRLLYSVPLIVSVSLVCAATRHEEMGPILIHALRFAIWVIVFMAIVLAVIQFLTWLQ